MIEIETNLLEIVRNDGRIRNANRSVTFSKKQPKRTKLQATIAWLFHHPFRSPRSEIDPSPTMSGKSPTIHV